MKNLNIITTRIRLARNLSEYPFTSRISEQQRNEILTKTKNVFENTDYLKNGFDFIELEKISDIDAGALVEAHLVSPNFINDKKNRAVIISKDRKISVMVNEEDHIRIQVIEKGLNFKKAYEYADRLDDILNEKLNFAFDDKLGYLTYCPTNLGTAMRASVLIHLPAITASSNMPEVSETASKLGISVRGLYGEGSEATCSLYQISNQISLGISEEQIIEKLENIIEKINETEDKIAKSLFDNSKTILMDKIMRAYGLLNNAYIMQSKEFYNVFSNVMFGIELGIINDLDSDLLHCLFIAVSPCTIMCNYGAMSAEQRDIKRCEIIKQYLSK